MIIGENIRISGTIEGAEDLVVRGRLEGTVRVQGTLTVEAGGWLIGEAHVTEAKVFGTVRGNLHARDAIEITRTGRMLGDATAPRVTIAAGAAFRGRVEMGDLPAGLEPPPMPAPGEAKAEKAAEPPAPPKAEPPAPPKADAPTPPKVEAPRPTAAASQQKPAPAAAKSPPASVGNAPPAAAASSKQTTAAAQQSASTTSTPPSFPAAPQDARPHGDALATNRPLPPLARPRTALKRRSEP